MMGLYRQLLAGRVLVRLLLRVLCLLVAAVVVEELRPE
jgi:hypothetical protein